MSTASPDRSSKQTAVRQGLGRRLASMSPGEPLPSERDLAREMGVARMTLRRAIESLVHEGRLLRRQGAGTFVAAHRVDHRLSATSFSEDMRARGLAPGSRTLWARAEDADAVLSERLGVDEGHQVLHVRRLRTADGTPMAVEDLHVPCDMVPGLSGSELEDTSFYELLEERFDLHIAAGTQTAQACLTSAEDAAGLGVDVGDPAFLFERISRLADGRVVEFVRSVYPGDRYRIVADIFPEAPPITPLPEKDS